MDAGKEKYAPEPGTLYLVSTPIGNIGDISERAKALLRSCDRILCEDTRHTGKLLKLLGIENTLVPNHEHNEVALAGQMADALQGGESLALVSDAGTPAISDPGFRLVRECRARGIPVAPVPGPIAAIAALSASGLPTDRFGFFGFLPPKSAARRRFLEERRGDDATLILYESPHRMEKFLDEIVDVLGEDRCICVARELTKLHETIHSGSAAGVREKVRRGSGKGEFVVLIAKEGYAL